MKKNFLAFAAVMFLCAVFLVVAGATLLFPARGFHLPLPVPTFRFFQ
jgi:hypothetical protein